MRVIALTRRPGVPPAGITEGSGVRDVATKESGTGTGRRVVRVLVTGGAGFLGSHLCDLLIARSHTVVCLDDLSTGGRNNIEHLETSSEFSFIEASVLDAIDIQGGFDGVIHLASPASPFAYLDRPIVTLRTGSEGTRNVLDFAKAKSARFILASTSEVYGEPLLHPQPEEYWGNVNPVGPRSVYDEAKRFGEAVTMAYHRVHAVDVRIARIFNTYGPRMRRNDGRAIPAFIAAALSDRALEVFGDGTQTRSFCYIDDLVEGVFRLATRPDLCGQIVNLGNDTERSLLDLAKTVKQLAGSTSPIVFRPLPQDDPKRRRPDLAKARRMLGYET